MQALSGTNEPGSEAMLRPVLRPQQNDPGCLSSRSEAALPRAARHWYQHAACWPVVLCEHDTDDTKSRARNIVRIHDLANLCALGSVSAANGEPQMRKALTALIAIVALAFAGVLVAAPKATKSTQHASIANAGIDIFSLTKRVQTLPEQSYPAH